MSYNLAFQNLEKKSYLLWMMAQNKKSCISLIINLGETEKCLKTSAILWECRVRKSKKASLIIPRFLEILDFTNVYYNKNLLDGFACTMFQK